jgi:hypothetical protein
LELENITLNKLVWLTRPKKSHGVHYMWIVHPKQGENAHRRITERKRNLKLGCGFCAHCRGANKVTLNWQRTLWEENQEVVKKCGRDE